MHARIELGDDHRAIPRQSCCVHLTIHNATHRQIHECRHIQPLVRLARGNVHVPCVLFDCCAGARQRTNRFAVCEIRGTSGEKSIMVFALCGAGKTGAANQSTKIACSEDKEAAISIMSFLHVSKTALDMTSHAPCPCSQDQRIRRLFGIRENKSRLNPFTVAARMRIPGCPARFWKFQDRWKALERHPTRHLNNLVASPPKWFGDVPHRAGERPNKTPPPNHSRHQAKGFEIRNQAAKTASLYCPQCKPGDEVFLHQEEHKDGRDCGDNAACTHHMIGGAILTIKGCDARSNRLCIGSLG